jgi:hypothetical protein
VAVPETTSHVTQVRSTLMSSSLFALRARDLEQPYLAQLPGEYHETIRGLVAGVWLPVEVAVVHYRAIDALALPLAMQEEIGRDVCQRLHGSLLGTVARLASTIGATPWHGLEQIPSIYPRIFAGGSVIVDRLGPKDAKVEFLGNPVSEFTYYRTSVRNVIRTGMELFCRRAFVNDGARKTAQCWTLRASWA